MRIRIRTLLWIARTLALTASAASACLASTNYCLDSIREDIRHQTLQSGLAPVQPAPRKPSALLSVGSRFRSILSPEGERIYRGRYYMMIELDDHYRGESRGSLNSSHQKVRYLTPDERFNVQVFIKDGKLVDRSGKALDGRLIFIMDESGSIYATQIQRINEIHHSTLSGGKSVAGAGELVIHEGQLMEINNSSGHYRPPAWLNQQVLDRFKQLGADVHASKVVKSF